MKILFLDIDGVVNCQTTNFKTECWPIDRYMAFLVGRIVLNTGCKVVLSSSWRIHPDGIETVEKHIVPILDRTSSSWYIDSEKRSSLRGEEVKKWLDEHPDVEKYAILDDDSDFLEGQPLFKTSWKTGLTDNIANKVIEHLNY
jgi:hypothetical protein